MTRFKTREKYCAVMVSGWGTEDTAQRRRLDRALGLAEAIAGLRCGNMCAKRGASSSLNGVDVMWFRLKLR